MEALQELQRALVSLTTAKHSVSRVQASLLTKSVAVEKVPSQKGVKYAS